MKKHKLLHTMAVAAILAAALSLGMLTGCSKQPRTFDSAAIEEVLTGDQAVISAKSMPIPDGFDQEMMLYSIKYQSGECEVFGYICFPSQTLSENTPSIVYNRGGNRNYGILTAEEVCRFAQQGYITLGSQYRGTIGGTGTEEFGGSDVDDVIALIDMALRFPFSDQSGVYMVGYSRGGMMTYLACARDDRIKAASVGAGMSDCFIMYETRDEGMKEVFHQLVGGGPDTHYDEFVARSATYWPEKIDEPVLICQGTNDRKVVPEQSISMHEKLEEAGKETEFILYTGATHAIYETTFVEDTVEWFRAHP
ncbi:MAG: prolyl oligopeptidase family serine peptidase [Clostridia bacterium]|nr:prolyl oligopeptidase family serine peptidase [Clostridia bacterium]